jgi:hypothetical protein
MKIYLIFPLIFIGAFSYCQSDATSNLLNAVSYGEFSYANIVEAVNSKADVNYIDKTHSLKLSVLSTLVQTMEFDSDTDKIFEEIKALRFLFENGAKLQSVDSTILFFPISSGNLAAAEILLKNGADAKNWPTNDLGTELTPIQLAAQNADGSMMALLQSYGAKPLKSDEIKSLSMIGYASKLDYQNIRRLLKDGVYVNYKNPSDYTALSELLSTPPLFADSYQTLLVLIDANVDVNQKADSAFVSNSLPLNMAVYSTGIAFHSKRGDQSIAKQVLQTLIKSGAYISGSDDEGKTPLHIAAERDNIIAAKMFIESGCKIQAKDFSMHTPLDYAKSSAMIKILKDNGAQE